MSKEHKEALARGRTEARAIKAYLNAVNSKSPGRPITKESLQQRLEKVNEKLGAESDPLKNVELLQSKLDIEKSLAKMEEADDFDQLEQRFVENAASYSDRKGISYTAWRQFGVPAAVLKQAGIPETRRR